MNYSFRPPGVPWEQDNAAERELGASFATLDSRFFGFVWNSGILAASAATGGVLIGLPLAYLASRRPTILNLGCLQAAYAGYVLPGPVAALAAPRSI